MTKLARRSLLAGASLAALPFAARAQAFPARPMTLIVPWAAGGSTDTLGRVLAQTMAADLGQPIVVENRGGASGTIGHNHVALAAPDGYTFLLATNSTYAIAPHLIPLPYDNRADFTGVSLVARVPQSLCIHPSVPAQTFEEFIALVRNRPGEMTFSSAGIGASSHLATELLMALTNTQMLHVPYRGGGPSVQGLLGGEVNCSFVDVVTALPFVRNNQLRMLAVSTAQRAQLAPDVRTLQEAGVQGFESSTDFAFLMPPNVPSERVDRIAGALSRALTDPATRERILALGIEPIGSNAAEFQEYWTRETEKWGDLIRRQNITVG